MLEGRNRFAEAHVAQMLESIVARQEVLSIRGQGRIAGREGRRSEGRETKQVVASVGHHVDREIVAGVDAPVGSHPVATGETLELDRAFERRVLPADEFGDLDDALECLGAPDLAVRGEARRQLEGDRTGRSEPGHLPVELGLLGGPQPVHRGALHDHRRRGVSLDLGDRGLVGRHRIGIGVGIGPREEAGGGAERAPGGRQHRIPLVGRQQVTEAGVHVHRRVEARLLGARDVGLEARPVHTTVLEVREQHGRDGVQPSTGGEPLPGGRQGAGRRRHDSRASRLRLSSCSRSGRSR